MGLSMTASGVRNMEIRLLAIVNGYYLLSEVKVGLVVVTAEIILVILRDTRVLIGNNSKLICLLDVFLGINWTRSIA